MASITNYDGAITEIRGTMQGRGHWHWIHSEHQTRPSILMDPPSPGNVHRWACQCDRPLTHNIRQTGSTWWPHEPIYKHREAW